MIEITHYLTLGSLLLAIGILGFFLKRQNIIGLLFSLEILLLGLNFIIMALGVHLRQESHQILTILILTVTASEAALALALVVRLFKERKSLDLESVNNLEG
jgi:NADH-quinone oxidoreductase subunit K